MKFRRTRHFILFLLLAVTMINHANAGFSMDVLNVGAGDCILLRTDHAVMMIDNGPSRAWKHIEAFLQEQSITQIDTLLLTHSHSDHCGNTASLFSMLPIGEVLLSSADSDYPDEILLQAADHGTPIRLLTRGDQIILDGLLGNVLWPDKAICALINDRSVVLRIDVSGFRMLFMGDAESETERYLLHLADPSCLRADLIKVGHHGMMTSSTYPLISAVQPTYALVSCGDTDHNATLSPIVRDTLRECGVSWILTTSEFGDIHLEISDTSMLTIW